MCFSVAGRSSAHIAQSHLWKEKNGDSLVTWSCIRVFLSIPVTCAAPFLSENTIVTNTLKRICKLENSFANIVRRHFSPARVCVITLASIQANGATSAAYVRWPSILRPAAHSIDANIWTRPAIISAKSAHAKSKVSLVSKCIWPFVCRVDCWYKKQKSLYNYCKTYCVSTNPVKIPVLQLNNV